MGDDGTPGSVVVARGMAMHMPRGGRAILRWDVVVCSSMGLGPGFTV